MLLLVSLFTLALVPLIVSAGPKDVQFLDLPQTFQEAYVSGTRIHFRFRPLVDDADAFYPSSSLSFSIESPLLHRRRTLTDVDLQEPLAKGLGYFVVSATLPDTAGDRWFARIRIKQRVIPFLPFWGHTVGLSSRFRVVTLKRAVSQGWLCSGDAALDSLRSIVVHLDQKAQCKRNGTTLASRKG